MAGKRGNGEGTIFQRASDNRWMGVLQLGYGPTGRPIKKSVSGKTRAEVVKKFKEMQRNLDDGLPTPDNSMTVARLIEGWNVDVLSHQVSKSAADHYLSIAKNHIIPTLGRKKLFELTTSDVDRLISKKIAQGLSVSTVRRIRSVLAQAIDQGMRWGWVNRNVATLARAPKSFRSEGRTLTVDEARLFLHHLEGHRLKALFTLMLTTGLRRGEALGLQWTDLDSKKRIITVRRQLQRDSGGLVTRDTKTHGSRRVVNLPTQMLDILTSHRQQQEADHGILGPAWIDSGFIFTTAFGGPLDPRNLLREFKKVCVEAGLGNWHLHELRHSAASLMLAQGVKLQVVSEVLGHSSIRMTSDVYGHILDPDREKAAEAIASVLWGK